MEYLGNIGHSTGWRMFVDGDGQARLKFTDKDGNGLLDVNNNIEIIKQRMDKNYDIKHFNLD
jgi:hypothetical protein